MVRFFVKRDEIGVNSISSASFALCMIRNVNTKKRGTKISTEREKRVRDVSRKRAREKRGVFVYKKEFIRKGKGVERYRRDLSLAKCGTVYTVYTHEILRHLSSKQFISRRHPS